LRDRREQILPLAEFFCDLYSSKYGKPQQHLSPAVSQMLREYHWPGNIRELQNVVKQLVLDGEEATLGHALLHYHHVSAGVPAGRADLSSVSGRGGDGALNLTLLGKRAAELAERRLIQDSLQETHWNRKEAARLLHISYKALLYKITKYGLDQVDRLQ
jgi:DNA-binding NtrC family response regulator